jgi:hypothetical protein
MDSLFLFLMLGVAIVGLIISITIKTTTRETIKYGDYLVQQSKESLKIQQELTQKFIQEFNACYLQAQQQGVLLDKLPAEMQEVIISQIPVDDNENFEKFMNKLHKDNSDKR